MEELTKTQKRVLQYLIRRQAKGLAFPTLEEMAQHFGIGSRAGMSGHLKALEKKGCLVRRKGYKRTADFLVPEESLSLYTPARKPAPKTKSSSIPQFSLKDTPSSDQESFPLVARIAAGAPKETYDQHHEFINFNYGFFGGGSIQALQVDGESMLGDGICDGDLALIKLQNHLDKKADVAAVRVDGSEITLKRIRKSKDIIELIPSNPDFPTRRTPADSVEILGKLVGVVRRV